MIKLLVYINTIVFYLILGTTAFGNSGIKEDLTIKNKSTEENTISLNGEWEFYWNELLTPIEFKTMVKMPSKIQVPTSWKSQSIDGKQLTTTGYGTYRKQFNIPAGQIGTHKALSLHYIGSAYRIWINGKEYTGLGVVGRSVEETIPRLQKNLIFFAPEEDRIEIIIQVSNFSFREGGIISNIVYGDEDNLLGNIVTDTAQTLIIIGSFLIIGLYHFLIFGIRKNEPALFFIGLASLAVAVRTFFVTEFVAHNLLPSLSWSLMLKIEYVSEIILFVSLVSMFKCLYPKEIHIFMIRLSYLIAVILLLLVLLATTLISSSLLPYYAVLVFVIMLYFIFYVGMMAAIRRREGAMLNLVGVLIILIATANDVLYSIGQIDTFFMMGYGFVIFILLQAVIVSNRYSLLFNQNVLLTEELMELNQSLEKKVNDRTKIVNESNKQLVKLQDARTKLLANIAHDIGTPLVGVQAYLQIIKEGKIHIDIQEVIPKIIDKISFIQRLNNDLFELSKLESQQLSFNKEKVQMNEFFNVLYDFIIAEYRSNDIIINIGQIDTKINGSESVVVLDKERIMQVIQNYVGNAIKFNESKIKTITLSCYTQKNLEEENAKDEIVVEIADNGIAISTDELPFIFERFYKKKERNPTGSGLGLAIVKEIIEQHGGTVGATSIVGVGSQFYFTLPCSRE